jgi:GxxExxY protein
MDLLILFQSAFICGSIFFCLNRKVMRMNADAQRLNEITEKIIGCAYDVANGLGCGFLEKVYENALRIDIQRSGLHVLQQYPIAVTWRGEMVGDYCADLFVEGSVIVELKAVKALDEVHMAQCLNYLKATGLKICLLINFGKAQIEVKRIVRGL